MYHEKGAFNAIQLEIVDADTKGLLKVVAAAGRIHTHFFLNAQHVPATYLNQALDWMRQANAVMHKNLASTIASEETNLLQSPSVAVATSDCECIFRLNELDKSSLKDGDPLVGVES